MSRRCIWLLHLLLIAIAAYLIASVGHELIGRELRDQALAELKARRAAKKQPAAEVRENNRIIVQRNYFGSTKTELSEEEKARLKAMGFARPHLTPETANKVFALAGEKAQEFTLACHIVEGRSCALEGEGNPKPLPKELAVEITDQVGPKYMEHAKDNGVRLHCERSAACRIDWGWGKGWEACKPSRIPASR